MRVFSYFLVLCNITRLYLFFTLSISSSFSSSFIRAASDFLLSLRDDETRAALVAMKDDFLKSAACCDLDLRPHASDLDSSTSLALLRLVCLFHFFFPSLFPSPFSSPLSPRSRRGEPTPRRGSPFRARRPCPRRPLTALSLGAVRGRRRRRGRRGRPLRRGRTCFGLSQFLLFLLASLWGRKSACSSCEREFAERQR